MKRFLATAAASLVLATGSFVVVANPASAVVRDDGAHSARHDRNDDGAHKHRHTNRDDGPRHHRAHHR